MSAAPPAACFECGAALSAGDTSGLCTRCIVRTGLVSQLAGEVFNGLAKGLTADSRVAQAFDFGSYRILSLLGRGGMGAVYEAEQIANGRRVALKVLGTNFASPEMRARFVTEGRLAAAVRHPNVVAVFAAEEIEGAAVIAMELVPSGTLKDRVAREGPMPPGAAVDAVLQIIDGLEAAHAQGVLHRDVKPANIFLSPDGAAKVGDFGLSISLAKSGAENAGDAVGTPAFASPEQLCGERLDVRADIFSVGATLYFLLTGRHTHDLPTVDEVINAVLAQDPEEPSRLRAGIPRDLSRVVMRCLSRKADARFDDYAALRDALLPFRSAAPVPAKPGVRFAAGLIDLLVMIAPSLAFHSAKGSESGMLIERDAASVAVYLAFVAWEILCVCVPEGLWGAGLGKAVCGLRVVQRGGGAPGIPRALLRGAVLALAMHLGDAVTWLARSPSEYQEAVGRGRFLPEEMLGLALLVVLFVPMRRRNGYAAAQDLLTGTRVVFAPAAVSRLPVPEARGRDAAPLGGSMGPFVECRREGDWIFARDEALDRAVWIREAGIGAPPVTGRQRDVCRVGRLRWLTGRRSAVENWDAYEAPDGVALAEFLHEEQPWARIRSWLLDVAEEMEASLSDGMTVGSMGTDRLWLTREGRVLVLDFPAPGLGGAERRGPLRNVRDAGSAQEFLHDLAAAVAPRRLPLHAREFLAALVERSFDSVGGVASKLRSDISRPAAVNLQPRLLSVIIAPAVAFGIMLTISLSNSRDARRFDALWAKEHGSLPSLRLVLEVQREQSVVNPAARERCAWLLAGRYRSIVNGGKFWGRPETEAWHEPARRVMGERAAVSAAELKGAEEWMAPLLEGRRERERSVLGWLSGGTAAAVNFLIFGALIGIGGTVIAGVPPGLRMNDLAIVAADGAPAGRGLALWRGLLGWLPLLLGAFGLAFCQFVPAAAGAFPFVAGAIVLVLAWLLSLTIRKPSRGLNDVIAGTWLVPR